MQNDDTLKAQQAVLLELWQVFDRICKKYQIQYMLFAGTALGAVRHGTIIPWDDDLDVVMLRKDYERFLDVAAGELDQDEYYLQSEFSDHWPMFFSKLRKNNTAFMERYIPNDSLMHQGIYIDIFPCDNLSDNQFVRRMQFLFSKVVIAHSLNKRGYLTNSKAKKIFMTFCRYMPVDLFRKFVRQDTHMMTEYVHTFFGGAKDYRKNIYPRAWFEQTIEMPFYDKSAPVSCYYDKLLTKLYGDYMTPLPESKRGCKVHAEIVDLECSYTKYLGEQKNMHFEEYTRSIR